MESAQIPQQISSRPIKALNPAIFIPFPPASTATLLTPAERSLTKEDQLKKIIANLVAQHAVVKQNMIVVAKERAKTLRKTGQAELDALGDIAEPSRNEQDYETFQMEINEAIRNMTAPIDKDSSSTDSEVKRNDFINIHTRRRSTIPGQQNTPRTPELVRGEVVTKLKNLINYTVDEINNYDRHAKSSIAHYQALLEAEQRRFRNPGFGNIEPNTPPRPMRQLERKRSVTFNTDMSAPFASPTEKSTLGPTRGILRHSSAQSPVDRDQLWSMDARSKDEMGWESSDNKRRRDEAKTLDEMRKRALDDRTKSYGKI